LRTDLLDGSDNIHALGHGAKHDVLAVQPLSLDGGQEELRAVGVRASVGHGQEPGASVLQLKVLHTCKIKQKAAENDTPVSYLVGKLGAVDGLSTGSIAVGEITSLQHELRDHTVEDGVL